MASQSSMIHIRMVDDLKARASEALAEMGLTASYAGRLLFHRIVADQSFPLELKFPNAETQAAIAEANTIFESCRLRLDSADPLFADLETTPGQ